MKTVLFFSLTIWFVSCFPGIYYDPYPLHLDIYYKQDSFKETKTAILAGRMIATENDSPGMLVSIQIKKQLSPVSPLIGKLEFDLTNKSLVEKDFFLKIDSQKYKIAFDSIHYFYDEVSETTTETDSDGSSSTSTTVRQTKNAVLKFTIPDRLHQAILDAQLFTMRYYISDFPYELTFHAHKTYRWPNPKYYSGSYYYRPNYISHATSPQRPIQLMKLKKLIKIKNEQDYQDFHKRYPYG